MIDKDSHSRQRTLKQPVYFEGKGLHQGKRGKIVLLPAKENFGIVFRCRHGVKRIDIAANWKNIVASPHCTALAKDGFELRTVEHLMAALYACSLTNVLIEVEGGEIPVLDGSAKNFFDKINASGLEQQQAKAPQLKIIKRVKVKNDLGFIELIPAADLEIDLTVMAGKLGLQRYQGSGLPKAVAEEIISARTFGSFVPGLFSKICYRFAAKPIGLGANINNCMVMVGKHTFVRGGMRYNNEHARHRVLDFLGDIYLSGNQLKAQVTAFRPSHAMNAQLMQKIFSRSENYIIEA